VCAWAARAALARSEVLRIGYFGSYARGDWGVGSDVDLIVVVEGSPLSFDRRAAGWDATRLPVPADVLVYTADEWERLSGGRFHDAVMQEAVWVYPANESSPESNVASLN
jgi:predicted nucleotidyltransferase